MSAYVGSPKNLKDLTDLEPNSQPVENTLLDGFAAMLCSRGLDVIRKEAWSFYKNISGVRLCWELVEPKGPKWPKASHV